MKRRTSGEGWGPEVVVDAFAAADVRTGECARSGGRPVGSEEGLSSGSGPRESPRAAVRNLYTLSQPAGVPAFSRARPGTNQGDEMTTTKTSSPAAAAPGRTPGTLGDLFSDEGSAVARAVPGAARNLPRPLDTLTWQEPPAMEDADDDAR